MSQEQEDVIRFPDEERSAQLEALEANYARVEGEVFQWNSHLTPFSTACVFELMTLMLAINALFLEYSKKCTELDECHQEYLDNLVALRDLEDRMAQTRKIYQSVGASGGCLLKDAIDFL
ncbi:hypothetical protein AMTR_s00152p00060740 [Amborella trichopoda]|uniref:Uncharacterized protein n=1 Tax=Amborella trichopoda TaxID=13333 RepID=W1PKD1_AMBTC|nr:hypothetical protein AMTR_s00152p00060740 [Amborella trichopoda]